MMRKEKRSGMNQTEASGLEEAQPENRGMERSQRNQNGEISPPPIRSTRIMDLSPPDPEVEEKPQRRKFTAAYKARIVQEADACTEKGQIGALLRREGLYSSQLTEWRQLYRQGVLTALRDDKRGRKKTNAVERENEKLRKQVAQLEHRLQQAETIIEVQKKISEILGLAQERPTKNEDE